jgi:hypothetical protein
VAWPTARIKECFAIARTQQLRLTDGQSSFSLIHSLLPNEFLHTNGTLGSHKAVYGQCLCGRQLVRSRPKRVPTTSLENS